MEDVELSGGDVRYPSIKQSIGLLLLLVLVTVGVGVVAGLLAVAVHLDPRAPILLPITNLVAIGWAVRRGWKKVGKPFASVFPLTLPPLSLFPSMALSVFGCAILVSEVDNLFRAVFPPPRELVSLFFQSIGIGTAPMIAFFTLAVVAPLTEEFLFRGLILRGFLLRYTAPKAIVVSALLFAVFHLNPWQLAGAFFLGVLFAWWYTGTRSLVSGLFGHALNNSLILLLPPLLGLAHVSIPGFTGTPVPGRAVFQPFWFDLLGAAMAGVGILDLKRRFDLLGPSAEAAWIASDEVRAIPTEATASTARETTPSLASETTAPFAGEATEDAAP